MFLCLFDIFFKVYVMGDDLYVSRNGTTTRQLKIVEHFIVHELYDPEKLHNDIAIIRVGLNSILSYFRPLYFDKKSQCNFKFFLGKLFIFSSNFS